MNVDLEKELCFHRIEALSAESFQIADRLLKIGYPNNYPEEFADLSVAYANLRKTKRT